MRRLCPRSDSTASLRAARKRRADAVVADRRRNGRGEPVGGRGESLGDARRDDGEAGVLASAMPAKLVMMPQTVPNRPTNGATDEITARLGRPPSARISSSRAARRIVSATRRRRSPALSSTTRKRAASRPGRLDRLEQRRGLAGARAPHGAGEPDDGEDALDDQDPAPQRGDEQVAITALPTGPASMNMPTGESDNPSISVPSRVRERLQPELGAGAGA